MLHKKLPPHMHGVQSYRLLKYHRSNVKYYVCMVKVWLFLSITILIPLHSHAFQDIISDQCDQTLK
jgi:hypothetical protein